MKVNYEEFLSRFESSGLTQEAFGKQEGISSSMVSYYVRRGREARGDEDGFAALNVIATEELNGVMKISYPSGVKVELPI